MNPPRVYMCSPSCTRSFPEPGTLPSPPPCLASAQRLGPAPGFLESPAGRWGPWGLPARPIASRSRARRGRRGGRSREDAAATSADEPDRHPRPRPAWSSAPPQPPAGRRGPSPGPQHLPSGPASPWAGCLCFHLPLSVLSFPVPSSHTLESRTGAEGRAVEVRGRTEVGVGWALGVSWYQERVDQRGVRRDPLQVVGPGAPRTFACVGLEKEGVRVSGQVIDPGIPGSARSDCSSPGTPCPASPGGQWSWPGPWARHAQHHTTGAAGSGPALPGVRCPGVPGLGAAP